MADLKFYWTLDQIQQQFYYQINTIRKNETRSIEPEAISKHKRKNHKAIEQKSGMQTYCH